MSAFRSDLLGGQVALITGGGTGICAGIARAFAAHGAATALVSRSLAHLEPTAAAISRESGQRSVPIAADVRDPSTVATAISRTLSELGRLDIVVNGAAGNFLCPAAALSPNGFATVMSIDAGGSFNVARAAFDAALRDHGGNIINISATLHYGATALQTHAAAAKAAVDALTRNLALEWGAAGVRVNGVAPGPIADTEGMARLLPPGLHQHVERQIPLGRFGRIADVADACLFLASEAASYVTGTVLVVDGGAWFNGGRWDLLPHSTPGGA